MPDGTVGTLHEIKVTRGRKESSWSEAVSLRLTAFSAGVVSTLKMAA